jgi:serine protease AprX
MQATEIKTTSELDYTRLAELLVMLRGTLINSLNLETDDKHRHIIEKFDDKVDAYHKYVKEKICGPNGEIVNNLNNQKELHDISYDLLEKLNNITSALKRELEIKVNHEIHDKDLIRDSRFNLLQSLDLNESCIALRYMADFASEEEDLKTIIKVRDNPKWFDSDEIKDLIRLAEQSIAIRLLRNTREEGWGKFNRFRLLNPEDLAEFEIALRNMAESEEEEDLIGIIEVKKKPPLQNYSDTVQKLLFVVEEKIFLRLREKRISIGIYQVDCDEGDLAYRFAADVHLVHIYPAFSIIIAPSKLIDRLKECYPTTRISEYISIPPKYLIGSEGNMIKVVQFNRPVDQTLREKIQTVGAEIVQALGGGLMAISSNKNSTDKILKFEEVNNITDYVPPLTQELEAIKNHSMEELVTPLHAANTENVDGSSLGILIAIFFNQKYRDRAAVVLPEHGIEVLEQAGDDKLLIDLFEHPNIQKAVQILTTQAGLQSIEEESIPTPFNNVAVSVIKHGLIPSLSNDDLLPSLDLRGTGELIAIADGGLDTGRKDDLHQDLRPQVFDIRSYPIHNTYADNIGDNCGAADRDGHGTHVVGSAIGTGVCATEINQNSVRGIAPEAQLIFQALEQKLRYNDRGKRRYGKQEVSGYYGIPTELKDLFSCAYQNGTGAKIHSNSWGNEDSKYASKYTNRCIGIDDFMWEHKDFLVVVAAGNNGSHFQDGKEIALGSICPPGTAKNCLTVGASENYRISEEFQETYGSKHGFTCEPFCNDITTDSIDDIAAFSSRGPCEDGRYKPDVVAPGTFILSTRSSQIANDDSCSAPYNNDYMYMCGSSMATPLVAGGVALVRQYLRENTEHINPSGALLKATVIHSAQYVDYRYRNSTSIRWVDNEQGWGRLTLANSLSPAYPISIEFIDQLDGLLLGEAYEYKVEITNSDVPIRIIMAYTDLPGLRLINNLNIRLTDPIGKYYLGNDFRNKKEHDLINNVEGIIVNTPMVGIWSITVTAYSLPEPEKGNQDFAVVASGGGLNIIETIKYSEQQKNNVG